MKGGKGRSHGPTGKTQAQIIAGISNGSHSAEAGHRRAAAPPDRGVDAHDSGNYSEVIKDIGERARETNCSLALLTEG